jgi:serine/threonine protein kinase
MSDPDFRETVPDASEDSARPPTHPARTGRVGQYVLLDLLGQGGMGFVYKARHALLGRDVALKVLASARLADPTAVARFLREIKAVGKLDHPNLVRGVDAGQADGRYFLVMDFVEGIDLGKLVQQLGPLPVADACELVRQAALGLQHAHEHDLVHRDVKPSNLLLTRDGRVIVLDLGLARLMGDAPQGEELTETGQYMGTADFMAPEQGLDARAVDTRADVYSLGCTLYKLLTGRAPFSGPEFDTTFKKIRAHTQFPVPPVREARPDVPALLTAVLGRMVAKQPDGRYASPAAVADALRPCATGCDLPGLAARAGSQQEISKSEPAPLTPRPNVTPVVSPKAWGSTRPRPNVSARGKWLRYAVFAVVLVAALNGFALWVVGIWPTPVDDLSPAGPPTTPAPHDPPLEEPAPGEWRDLMVREPAKLAWPRDERLSPLVYSGPGKPLAATCSNARGLVAFARTDATEYELEMEFPHLPWSGDVGFFFGYYAEPEGTKTKAAYQFLRLRLKDPQGAENTFLITWEKLVVVDTQIGPKHLPAGWFNTSDEIEGGRNEHRLRAVITELGLAEVYWDDQLLKMGKPPPAPVLRQIRQQGVFGVCLSNNNTTITKFRYRAKAR